MSHPSPNPSPTPLQASKWLQIQMLLEVEEMQSLFDEMGDFYLYLVGKVTEPGAEQISKETFLKKYSEYLSLLKSGVASDTLTEYRSWFSVALTKTKDQVFSIPAGNGKQLTRASLPIVQMQLHMMGYSVLENKFRPMVLGKESVHWGIQLSYPQLYQDPETKKIDKVLTDDRFPNTELFRKIQNWMRKHTVPTPFFVDDVRINVPIRLGRECFGWINNHPQLSALEIKVLGGENAH